MYKAGDSEPTDLLETPISLSVLISNHLVHCSHSWDIPFGNHYFISAFFLQLWLILVLGPLLYEMTSYCNLFFFSAGAKYSIALSPTSAGLISIVHSILIRIGHLSSMLNDLEMQTSPNRTELATKISNVPKEQSLDSANCTNSLEHSKKCPSQFENAKWESIINFYEIGNQIA